MSWNISLYDDRGHEEGSWNYTHNTNRMIRDVLADIELENSWWQHLNNLPGPEGAAYLDIIIRGLESDPGKYRMMNPENGWGDYDTLLTILQEMRATVPEWPTIWTAHG